MQVSCAQPLKVLLEEIEHLEPALQHLSIREVVRAVTRSVLIGDLLKPQQGLLRQDVVRVDVGLGRRADPALEHFDGLPQLFLDRLDAVLLYVAIIGVVVDVRDSSLASQSSFDMGP